MEYLPRKAIGSEQFHLKREAMKIANGKVIGVSPLALTL
jgi:hypothetical protein